VAVCSIAAVGLLVAAVVVAGDRGSGHPDAWDERVADLAAFVERERGLDFEHPVRVDFLTEAEYSEAARVDEGVLTDEDRELLDESAAVLEALGLVSARTDLLDLTNEMADTGTLAYYDPITETVTVRGTEMTTVLAATLVHEPTHVAQDQAFDLERIVDDDESGSGEGLHALVEGDAVRIEAAYVESLAADEQDAYWDDYLGQVDDAEAGLDTVPAAMQALFAAPYVLGDPFGALVAADGGNRAVDDAFASPPASSEHLIDPGSFFADDAPVDVVDPDLPDGAERVGEPDVLGAVGLFVLLSERLDAEVALVAADGWGGDRYAVFRDADRTCVRVALVADTPGDLDEVAAALRDWVAGGPAGAASVEVAGETVALDSCAAGADAGEQPAGGASLDALTLPATRAQLAVVGATQVDLDRDGALDFGACFVDRVPLDTLLQANEAPDPPAEVTAAVADAMVGCTGGP
jgi:hypothetical protein